MILIVTDTDVKKAVPFEEGDCLTIRIQPGKAGVFALTVAPAGSVLTEGSFEEMLTAFNHVLEKIADHTGVVSVGGTTVVTPHLVIRLDRL